VRATQGEETVDFSGGAKWHRDRCV